MKVGLDCHEADAQGGEVTVEVVGVPSASVRMGRISAETGDGTDFTGVVWFLRAPGARDFRPAVRDCGAPAPDRPVDFYPASGRRVAPG